MEITVKEAKVVSTGTNKSGDWELIRVTSADNTEYTTFDKKAKSLTSGSVIDIGDPIIKEGKISFKEFKVISAAAILPSGDGPEMSKEDWAEKDRRKEASIEGQNALTNLTTLTIAGIKLEDCPALLKQALQSKIKGFLDIANTPVPPKVEAKAKAQEKVEKDVEELFPLPGGKSEKQADNKALLAELQESVNICNWTYKMVQDYATTQKDWGFTLLSELKPEHIAELIKHINKNPK